MATPQICPIVPPGDWMNKQQVAELALDLGYDKVHFVQPDGGCWVAYSEKDGVRYEVFFHPASGEVVRVETGS
ncbi:MAG: PepSY domain-containing protein [Candidatus Thiodiazotropha lotti]|nr:PepSY domain-containing protein [Candidatus Thiodiazotropha lotti]MCG8002767.1 PepSY domain-containing protein [Candidatus Thiodiazotropha lotti]MCG8007113.1 PepSY domain-containing protein [Candidatus Thiodiazotropha lotti]